MWRRIGGKSGGINSLIVRDGNNQCKLIRRGFNFESTPKVEANNLD